MEFSKESKFLFFAVFMPGIFALIPVIYGFNYFYSLREFLSADGSFSAVYLVIMLPIVYMLGITTDDLMKWAELAYYKKFKRKDPFFNAIFQQDKQNKLTLQPYVVDIHKELKKPDNKRWKFGFYNDDAGTEPLPNKTLPILFSRLKTAFEERAGPAEATSFQEDKQMAYYFLRNISLLFFLLGIEFLLVALANYNLHIRKHPGFVYATEFCIWSFIVCILISIWLFRNAVYKRQSFIAAVLIKISILKDKLDYKTL